MAEPVLFAQTDVDGFTEEEVKHFLNATPEIANWIQVFPNVYIIMSMVPASKLYKAFAAYSVKNGYPDDSAKHPRHVFLDTNLHGNGILQKGTWEIIRQMRDREEEIPF